MGIMTGIGTGIGGISSTIYTYQKLSAEFNNDIKQVTQSIEALQDQVDSLASVVLQNRCALDLLITEKAGTCLFLNEECWFYANKSGVIRDMAQQLKESVTKRRQELANSWSFWDNLWG
jgi:septal ring factor EnvC (AmiA/AmiB activator)